MFELEWTDEAKAVYTRLKANPSEKVRYEAVKKTLEFLAENPRHPSLQTHPFLSLEGPKGEKVFEAYAQQNTPAAYRVFWYYGPQKRHNRNSYYYRAPKITSLLSQNDWNVYKTPSFVPNWRILKNYFFST